MTTQQPEVGHVVGWTMIVDPDGPKQWRIDGTTPEHWRRACMMIEDLGLGIEFVTRILGPYGLEEDPGASIDTAPGTKMVRLACKYCGKKEWFPLRPNPSTECVCADCSDIDSFSEEIDDCDHYEGWE